VRRRVVGLGGVAGGAVDARDDLLALVQRALLHLDDDRLVVAGAHDVDDARAAVARLAGDHAGIGDLPAALGVERRAVELEDVVAQRGDGRDLLQRLVAGELRRWALDVDAALDGPVHGRRAGTRPLLLHALVEAVLV